MLAAVTALITALVLQATLVAPAAHLLPLSLPAVLVAGVALVDGPAAGMSFGFATGLVADLGSAHPAGILALCWLGVGLVCGALGERRSRPRDALTVGVVCGLASAAATLLLALVRSSGSVHDVLIHTVPAAAGDAALALLLLPLLRLMLRSDSLRPAHPVYTELAITRHG